MKSALPRLVLALSALAVGAAFVVLDPEQWLTASAGKRLGIGVLAATVWLGGLVSLGGAVLRRLAPSLLGDDDQELLALAVGLGVWGLVSGGLAAAGLLQPTVASVGLVFLWVLAPLRPRPRLPHLGQLAIGVLVVVALVGLIDAAAPPIGTDERYYHLALPRRMLGEGGLLGGLLSPDGSRPMALHVPFAFVMAHGGDVAVRVFHLLLALATLCWTHVLARRTWGHGAGIAAMLLLVGSWSVISEVGHAANDLPTALCLLAAWSAAQRGSWSATGLAGGAALAIKYTAAGPFAGVLLAASMSWRSRVFAGLLATALVVPWWVHNLSEGLHPLFPFAGWPGEFTFQYLEKYGAGRSFLDFVLLPWNAVVEAEIRSFRFLGKLSPTWLVGGLAALPLLWRGKGRPLGIVALLTLSSWAAGPHWLRYLVPGLPLLAVAVAGVVPVALARGDRAGRLAIGALLACWLAGLPANWSPVAASLADRLDAATGQEEPEEYLARTLDDWPVIVHARDRLPPDARVALLFSWSAYHLDRPVLVASVEDHVPTRHLLLSHGDDSLEVLRAAGATHVLTSSVRFRHRIYPFLDEAHFDATFPATEELLDELLLTEAWLEMQDGRHRLYRLGPSELNSSP